MLDHSGDPASLQKYPGSAHFSSSSNIGEFSQKETWPAAAVDLGDHWQTWNL